MSRLILLLGFLAFVALAPAADAQTRTNPQGMMTRLDDTGLRGSSFHTETMKRGQRNVCMEACQDNPICEGYSWRKGDGSRDPECKLFHFVFETVPTSFLHAGRRAGQPPPFEGTREQATQFRGETYKTIELPLRKPKMCRDACATDGQCQAYSYFKPGTRSPASPPTCELMTAVDERLMGRDCCVSGARSETFENFRFHNGARFEFQIVAQTEAVADISACVHLCKSDSTCRAAAYRKTTATDPLGRCEMSTLPPVASHGDAGFTSFERQTSDREMEPAAPNTAAGGPLLQRIYLDVEPADGLKTCRAACGLAADCKYANYVPPSEPGAAPRCDLRSQYDASRRVDGCCTSSRKRNDSKPPSPLAPGSVPTRLRFSENSRFNPIEGDRYPQDMPNVRFPVDWQGCSLDDQAEVRRAWARAHYNVWRATQVLTHLNAQSRRRAEMWAWSFNDRMGTDPNYNNITPRGYFGGYNHDRFHTVRRVMGKLFHERLRGKTFKVKCRLRRSDGAHPCETVNGANANHFVYGTINICRRWFDAESRTSRAVFNNQVTIITHELLHWMKIPGSAYWVSDRHDYWRSCRDYRGALARYDDAAVWLGMNRGCKDWNHNRAVRANDNYAWWATMLGDRIYRGRLPQFPAENF